MGGHSRVLVLVHVVWSTLNRQPVLAVSADRWLARLLSAKAAEVDCGVVAAGNASDHVHVVLALGARACLADVARRLKGASSHAWNQRHAVHLSWQKGYWAESVSARDLDGLQRYVVDQRRHHANNAVWEPWPDDVPQGSSSHHDSPPKAGLPADGRRGEEPASPR